MDSEEIKAKRLKHNLTQEELAGKLGVSVVTIQRWERGKFRPSRLAVNRLKAVLK